MYRAVLTSILLLVVQVTAFADKPIDPLNPEYKIQNHLNRASVTVISPGTYGGFAYGTGTLIVRKIDDINVGFVLTAYHVVGGLRHQVGECVHFIPPRVYQKVNGVGVCVQARVLISSPSNDIAVLQLPFLPFTGEGVEFVLDKNAPNIGTEVFHVGNFDFDTIGPNSFSDGVVAGTGRILDGFGEFDQTTCTALPGSSGGLVARKSDGKYLGTLVRGRDDNVNLIVPVRNIVKWSIDNKVEYLFNPSTPKLTFYELNSLKVETEKPSEVYELNESGIGFFRLILYSDEFNFIFKL